MSIKETAQNALQEKKRLYTILWIAFCIFPLVGYLSTSGFALPAFSELLWFPVNLGTYGIAGIFACLILPLICATIWVFINRLKLGLIKAFLIAILFFGLVVTIFVDIIMLGYNAIISWANSLLNMPVPGASEFLGSAILNSLLYDIPLIVFIFKSRAYHKLSKNEGSAFASEID